MNHSRKVNSRHGSLVKSNHSSASKEDTGNTLENYIIQGGRSGSDRLTVLAEATWPTSEQFLISSGLRSKMRCLDLGCGNGNITLRMAEIIGPEGSIVGIDADQLNIEVATNESERRGMKIAWHHSDLRESFPPGEFDFIYIRLLLSHLADPLALLKKAYGSLRQGGILAIEDVDFEGHFSYPKNQAFSRYVELYQRAGKLKGVDPFIGPRLIQLVATAQFTNPKISVALPTFMKGDGKRMAILTLLNIKPALISEGLSTEEELFALMNELERFTNDETTMMSLPRFFQVCAQK